MMRVALVGFGAVGCGVAEAVREGVPFDCTVVGIADSSSAARDPDGLDLEVALERKAETGRVGDESDGPAALVAEAEYDVLIEASPTTLGDAEPAYGHMTTALERGADVVTSNKGPLAMRYDDLMATAAQHGGRVRMEGAVGGAMPVVNTVTESLAGNEVTAARGILNGTCNFILTRMLEEGLPYDHVLGEAQDMGIAEADPTFDVEGIDTALKCVILSNVLFEETRTLDDAEIEGITEVTPDALRLARDSGHVVKLVGEVDADGLTVAPRLVPTGSALDVGGTLNVVAFDTALAGEVTVTGRGAGSTETASAIVSDLAALARER